MKKAHKQIINCLVIATFTFPTSLIKNSKASALSFNNISVISSTKDKADSWETKTQMPTKRAYLTSSVVNNKIYCIGGRDNTSTYLGTVEVYDPATDKWETKSPMPTPRGFFTSEVINGKIYCIGGRDSINMSLDTVEVYDPITDKWETKSPMIIGKRGLASATLDGKIYIIGGVANSANVLDSVEAYDPITDKWETKSSMAYIRNSPSAVAANGKIYCIGGRGNPSYLNTIEIYDPLLDKWTLDSTTVIERAYTKAVYTENKIYIIGGYDGSKYFNTVEEYDLISNTVKIKTDMPTIRADFAASVLGNKIYAIGGYDNVNYFDTVEAYIVISEEEVAQREAEKVVGEVEISKNLDNISNARDLVNKLPESLVKDQLQNRLNNIFPDLTLDKPERLSVNTDIYFKMKNKLSLSLDTNSIIFDDFDGTEDIVKQNAINLTVDSSLPYEINSSLETEIQNIDGSENIDKSILSVKGNTENNYKNFTGVNTPITLLDIQDAGKINTHGIDLKLNTKTIPKVDAYKTTIRFEVKQK